MAISSDISDALSGVFVRKALHEIIKDVDSKRFFQKDPTVRLHWLNALSDRTLRHYLDTITMRPEDCFEEILIQVLENTDDDRAAGYVLEIIKADPFYRYDGSVTDSYDRKTDAYFRAKSILRGLSYCRGLSGYEPPVDILVAQGMERAKVVALIRVTHRLCEGDSDLAGLSSFFADGHVMHISTAPLINLILKRPENADRIAEIVMDRSSDDVALIEDILDSKAPIVSEGIL